MGTLHSLDINEQFQYALELIEGTGKSLFITGRAGTGKSTLLEYFCKHSRKSPVVLAPTGVAALNVKGQTIHNFFNFHIDVTLEKIKKRKTRPRNEKLYKKLQVIIIDEISMVRADLLDCIDMFLRLYGPQRSQPFGGVQMVFIGDLYQLPPVVTEGEKEIFSTHYTTPYFFSSHVIEGFPFEIIELEKVYRQKDQQFINLLSRVRNNSVTTEDIQLLNSRVSQGRTFKTDDFYISLTATNKKADEINNAHLYALEGDVHHYEAEVEGDFGKEYFPTAPALQFKIGSQIMLLTNDPKKRWVNGSIGIIESIHKDENNEQYVNIRLQDNQRVVPVSPFMWEVFRFSFDGKAILSEAVGTFTQYPFRLAWAITIHKSQGKTFNHVVIDIGAGTFAAGQMYVALSRCTSFEGMVLKTPIRPRDIRTDGRIMKFLTGYHYKQSAKTFPIEDKMALIQQSIQENASLAITYLAANDTKSQHIIQPLTVGIEDYQGKKFPGMKAFCTTNNEERMFHVGRIVKLKRA